MGFVSILGSAALEHQQGKALEVPDFFQDLNLDQVLEIVVESKKEYGIEKHFYQFAGDVDAIRYRQDVFRDLEDKTLFDGVTAFGRGMAKAHEFEGYHGDCSDEWQRRHWYLDFAYAYCASVNVLRDLLAHSNLRSKGFISLRAWLNEYCETDRYQGFYQKTLRLVREFETIRYSLEIDRDKVVVNPVPIAEDYCKRLNTIFGLDGEPPYMDNPLAGTLEMPHLERRILGVLMKPYQKVFEDLMAYCDKKFPFMDETVLRFEREVPFYLSFLLFKQRMEAKGFAFAYPEVGKGEFRVEGLYDIALAWKSLSNGGRIVCNDAHYEGDERFFLITGPNQGGKTTFARAMGQILYFAKMGMPAPCKAASLPELGDLLTHFSVEESTQTGRGKLKEELIRLKPMMKKEAKDAFLVINELFTTAATYDAFLMGRRVIEHFIEKGCYGVYVTHISDLAKQEKGIVSMTAGIDERDGNRRTFLIKRRETQGVGYANTLVEKYGLTYQDVKGALDK